MTLKSKLTPGLIEALVARKTTARAVAELLGTSESYLSRTLADMQVVKEPAPTAVRREKAKLNASRREFRLSIARQVLDKTLSMRSATKLAFCSERTMYRYVEKASTK
jgi:transposase